MPKVQDALGYLEKVKSQFASHPSVYNQFLEIMKDFKSQSINTEGVIKRVKTLFRGHKSLILGFNQFLPPGFKIEFDEVGDALPAPSSNAPQGGGNNVAVVASSVPPSLPSPTGSAEGANVVVTAMNTMTHMASNSAGVPPSVNVPSAAISASPTMATVSPPSNPPLTSSASSSSQSKTKSTIELKHAVQYVAKIKNRFREQPEIYAEFLDILHDYQAKRTIDEVYQRVQKLFGGQPDLLDEFKYFLPDHHSTMTSGKGSSRYPSSSSSKSKMKSSSSSSSKSKSSDKHGSSGNGRDRDRGTQGGKDKDKRGGSGRSKSEREREKIDRERDDRKPSSSSRPFSQSPTSAVSASFHPTIIRPNLHSTIDLKNRQRTISYPPGSEKELRCLESMKNYMSKTQWIQFLKSLNLFANDIITRPELVRMVEDLLSDKPNGTEFIEKFKSAIGFEEYEERQLLLQTQTNYYAFVSSVDFSTCPQVTPSYRELPSAIQPPHCSGRTTLCEQVLNDTFISNPTGSEDFSFKSTRKNIYEENLFKVEDERFELDMAIENNAAAIRVLEPIAESASTMSKEQLSRLHLGDNMDILHIRSIARIYGENGYEIIELLNRNPAIASKVILERLRQKDEEWRKVRSEMKNVWRKVTEQNYQRSLDHRSFYFKQEDKKRRSPRALVAELREVHQQVFGPSLTGDDGKDFSLAELVGAGEESIMLRQIRQGHAPKKMFTYCISFKYGDSSVHEHIFEIVMRLARSSSTLLDQVRIATFFEGFVHHFFGFDPSAKAKQEIAELKKRVDELMRTEAEQKALAEAAAKESAANPSTTTAAATPSAPSDTSTSAPSAATPSAAAAVPPSGGNGASNGDAMVDDDDANDVADEEKLEGVAEGDQATSTRRRRGGPGGPRKRRGGPGPAAMAKKRSRVGGSIQGGDEEEDHEPDVETDNNRKRPGGGVGIGFERKEKSDDAMQDSSMASTAAIGGQNPSSTSSSSGSSQHDFYSLPGSNVPSIIEISQRIASAASSEWWNAGSSSSATSHVKPLRLQMDTWALEEKLNPVRRHLRPSHLFFGSNAYYVFFRLHQFLYERLATAKTLANKTRRLSNKKKVPATPEERWGRFNSLLTELIDNGMESNRFEDECRNLLGASSFVLFTIDKLISQLVKQTLALLNSEVSLQLLCLYQYELRRSRSSPPSLERSASLCRQYHMNCQMILADDNCVEIEFFNDTSELGIGLTDAAASAEPKNSPSEWNQYIDLLCTAASTITKPLHGNVIPSQSPFLLRNVKKTISPFIKKTTPSPPVITSKSSSSTSSGGKGKSAQPVVPQPPPPPPFSTIFASPLDMELFTIKSLRQCQFSNELEMKIDYRTYKIYYVDSTEDCLCRLRGREKGRRSGINLRLRESNGAKMRDWSRNRLNDLFPGWEERYLAQQAALLEEEANKMNDDSGAASALVDAAAAASSDYDDAKDDGEGEVDGDVDDLGADEDLVMGVDDENKAAGATGSGDEEEGDGEGEDDEVDVDDNDERDGVDEDVEGEVDGEEEGDGMNIDYERGGNDNDVDDVDDGEGDGLDDEDHDDRRRKDHIDPSQQSEQEDD